MLVPCGVGSVSPLVSIYRTRAGCSFFTHASSRLETEEAFIFMFMCYDVISFVIFWVSFCVSYVSDDFFRSLLR